MSNSIIQSRIFFAAYWFLFVVLILSLNGCQHQTSEDRGKRIHFLVPGSPGGGWDGTARGVGAALQDAGLIETASYENMSGGGGGKAIAHIIETAARQQNTLMVNSTPIVVRSLQKVFPQSFRDLTPVASIISDFSAFVVRADSPYQTWNEAVTAFQTDPFRVKIAGGSVLAGTDHLAIAMAFMASGCDPKRVVYVPYDAGGKALAGLLSGETDMLSTGLSEILDKHNAGQVRILVITAEQRSSAVPEVPTMNELGYDFVFANWRGFFGPPGLTPGQVAFYTELLAELKQTPQWREVRDRRGWNDLFLPAKQFREFLQQQETDMRDLMQRLGFTTMQALYDQG